MRFAKLITDDGRQIEQPKTTDGSVSLNANDGRAQAWAADGRTLLAELAGARVVWIGAAGLRLEGLEPIHLQRTRF